MHSLPRDQEEIINDILREFKLNYVLMSGDKKIRDAGTIDLDFNMGNDVITIPAYDDDEEHNIEIARAQAEARRKNKDYKKSQKYKKYKNPTRAMKKQELQKIIREEEEWEI